jgi:hypothetical protein
MPVTHRHHTVRIHSILDQPGFKCGRLLFGETANGGAAADSCIMLRRFLGARAGDQLGERTASDARKREVNNVGIAKEVIKKRFDRGQRIRSTELEKYYTNTFRNPHHSPDPQPMGAMLHKTAVAVNASVRGFFCARASFEILLRTYSSFDCFSESCHSFILKKGFTG